MIAKPFPVFLLSAAAVMALTGLVSFFPFLRNMGQPWIAYFALIASGVCCWSYWRASASSKLGANMLARIVGVAALGAVSFAALFLAASWTWVLLGNQM